jgi:hypothetical protein
MTGALSPPHYVQFAAPLRGAKREAIDLAHEPSAARGIRGEELSWPLRGQAEGRQVEGARIGITANQGLFGHGSSIVLAV